MPGLATLIVDFNQLVSLPASLAQCRSLVKLYASFNRISVIPDVLFRHPSIVYMDISTNRLTSLPDIKMPYLITLHASNNSILSIPSSLFNLPHIGMVFFDGNKIHSLPSSVGNAENTLYFFVVARNNLTEFPPSFAKLRFLKVLDIRNNSIEHLPGWNTLVSMEHLYVAGNPLCQKGWVGTGRVRALMAKEQGGCTRQCSDMCLNSSLDNGGCDIQCNVPECNYDNGSCKDGYG